MTSNGESRQGSIQTEIALAQAAFQRGDLPAAEVRLRGLDEQYPKNGDICMALGVILNSKGEASEALERFQVALEANPHSPEVLGWTAFTCLNLGRFQEAEKLSRRFVEVAPGNQWAYFLLAGSLRALDRFWEALEAIDQSLRLKPDHVDSLVMKARILKACQMPSLAIEFYKKALAIQPSPSAAIDLAKMHLRESHPELALQVLQEVEFAMNPAVRPHALVAEAYTLLRQFDAAEERWVLAMKSSRDTVGIAQIRAKAEIAVGRFQLAEEILTDLIERDQDMPGSFQTLSTAKKMTPQDRRLIERVSDLLVKTDLATHQRMNLNYALGKSFDDLRDFERAMGHFDEANRLGLQLFPRRREFNRAEAASLTDLLIRSSSRQVEAAASLESSLPLFVVGMMRSGTTLTESILSGHSQVSSGGEQSFWTERGSEFIYSEGGTLKLDQGLIDQFGPEYLKLIGSSRGETSYVVDKNPENFNLASLLLNVFSNARMIHITRNPVDNLLSLWMTPVSGRVNYMSNRENLVFAYREYLRLWDHWRTILPSDRFVTFHYEDLTSNPRKTITEMLEFLGLDLEDACLTPESNNRSILTPSVYQARQSIHTGSQARWKNYEPWLGSFADLLEE